MRFIPVGRVVASHGLKGTVRFRYYNEDRDQFYSYASLYLNKDGKQTKLSPTEVRFSKGFFYVKFEGFNSPEKSSFLVNEELCVREEDLPSLDNDEYYDYQLIGLNVVNYKNYLIGTVTGVIHTCVQDIMVVTGKEEMLVPMVEGLISKIDLKDSFIVVNEDGLHL